jgi:molybdopterin-guanine dinucleotide biosynthesis protein A
MSDHRGASRPAALLLTGGSSRRMGRDKATLVVSGAGAPLAERTAALLVRVAAPVLEIGPGHAGLPHVQESPPGGGPLCALAAGWAGLKERQWPDAAGVLVVATDLPRLTAGLLAFLADYPATGPVVPLDGEGRSQPLCARYPMAALGAAARLVEGGERSLRALLAGLNPTWVARSVWQPAAGDPDALADVDTPADLTALT